MHLCQLATFQINCRKAKGLERGCAETHRRHGIYAGFDEEHEDHGHD